MITYLINKAKSYLDYSAQETHSEPLTTQAPDPSPGEIEHNWERLGEIREIVHTSLNCATLTSFYKAHTRLGSRVLEDHLEAPSPCKKTFGALILIGLVGGQGLRSSVDSSFSPNWDTATKVGLVFGGSQFFGPFGGVAAWAMTSGVHGYTPPEVVGNCPEVYRETWGENLIGCELPTRSISMIQDETYFMGGFHKLVSAPDGNILKYSIEGLPQEANITQETLLFENKLWSGASITCLQQPNSSLLVGFSGPDLYVWQRTSTQLTLLNSTNFGQTLPFLGGVVNGQMVFLRTNSTLEMVSISQPQTPFRYPPISKGMAAHAVDPVRNMLWATASAGDRLLAYSIGNPTIPTQYADFAISGGGAFSVTLAGPYLLLIPGPNNLRRFNLTSLLLPTEASPIPVNGTVTGVVMNQAGFAVAFTPSGYTVWNVTGSSPRLITRGGPFNPGVNIQTVLSSDAYLFGHYTGADTGIVVLKANANQTLSPFFAPFQSQTSFVLSQGNTVIRCGENLTSYTIGGLTVQLTPNQTGTFPFSFQAVDDNGGNVTVPMRLAILGPNISGLTTHLLTQLPPAAGAYFLFLLALPFTCLVALLCLGMALLSALFVGRKKTYTLESRDDFQLRSDFTQIDYEIAGVFGDRKFGILSQGVKNQALIKERYGIVLPEGSGDIGSGGFGSVELVVSMSDGKLAAAKKIVENPEGQFNKYEASIREANLHKLVASQGGEGIWPILNTTEEGELGRRTMRHMFPFAEFGNLEQFLGKFIFNPFNPTILPDSQKNLIQRSLARSVLSGFLSAHKANVTHADPKDDNVLVGTQTAGLSDFGRAREGTKKEPLTSLPNDLGAIIYFSPGRLHAFSQGKDGRFDGKKADAFGAGSILLKIMSGENFYQRLCLTGENCSAKELVERAKDLKQISGWFQKVVEETPALKNPQPGSLAEVTKGLLLEALSLEHALKKSCFENLPPHQEIFKDLLQLQIQLCQNESEAQERFQFGQPDGNIAEEDRNVFGIYQNESLDRLGKDIQKTAYYLPNKPGTTFYA